MIASACRAGYLGENVCAIVAFDDTVGMARMAPYAFEFCTEKSGGKCTPCHMRSTRGVEVMERVIADRELAANVALLRDLCEVMLNGLLCALDGMTPYPVLRALNHFPADFGIDKSEAA